MPKPKHILAIPKRELLSVQTAAAMRRAFEEGMWANQIPSERRLCEMFHVSRPTVRSALNILAKDGLIALQRHRRVRVGALGRAHPTKNKKILIVTHRPYLEWATSTYQSLSEMQGYLGKHGFECEIILCQPRRIPSQLRKLAEFIRQNGVACTLLVTVRRELQQWFATLPTPTLVIGSCHPSVALPSFDVDYRAACRHAAGVFLSKGHRRLALLVPASRGPGDLASARGFLEGVEETHAAEAKAVVVFHDGTAQNINARLDVLFRSEDPPTAILVSDPEYFLMVFIYLLRKGPKVSERISLIARDQDTTFTRLIPAISHYAFDIDASTRRLARLILKLIDQKHLPLEPCLILPKYISGGTVKNFPG